jgi:hypothetical protein
MNLTTTAELSKMEWIPLHHSPESNPPTLGKVTQPSTASARQLNNANKRHQSAPPIAQQRHWKTSKQLTKKSNHDILQYRHKTSVRTLSNPAFTSNPEVIRLPKPFSRVQAGSPSQTLLPPRRASPPHHLLPPSNSHAGLSPSAVPRQNMACPQSEHQARAVGR